MRAQLSLAAAVAHITNYSQPTAINALTQQLQALVLALVSSSKTRLSVDQVVSFVLELLNALPSSSAPESQGDSQARTELCSVLLDTIWTVDVALDDSLPVKSELPSHVRSAYEQDKSQLAQLVKTLVVRTPNIGFG
jgi:hypothetical protein